MRTRNVSSLHTSRLKLWTTTPRPWIPTVSSPGKVDRNLSEEIVEDLTVDVQFSETSRGVTLKPLGGRGPMERRRYEDQEWVSRGISSRTLDTGILQEDKGYGVLWTLRYRTPRFLNFGTGPGMNDPVY